MFWEKLQGGLINWCGIEYLGMLKGFPRDTLRRIDGKTEEASSRNY